MKKMFCNKFFWPSDERMIFFFILGLKSADRISVQDKWTSGSTPVIAATVRFDKFKSLAPYLSKIEFSLKKKN